MAQFGDKATPPHAYIQCELDKSDSLLDEYNFKQYLIQIYELRDNSY